MAKIEPSAMPSRLANPAERFRPMTELLGEWEHFALAREQVFPQGKMNLLINRRLRLRDFGALVETLPTMVDLRYQLPRLDLYLVQMPYLFASRLLGAQLLLTWSHEQPFDCAPF